YFLDHMDDFRGPSLFSCATRLLRHMSRIFQEQTPKGPARTISFTDKKLRQRIREKKIAMGHKADDYEERMQQI
ncbi:MAG: restriction endonuclease, partial [Clostridiales bacterium]|nr:restriction endonuclease [Clostridiales bacterium]